MFYAHIPKLDSSASCFIQSRTLGVRVGRYRTIWVYRSPSPVIVNHNIGPVSTGVPAQEFHLALGGPPAKTFLQPPGTNASPLRLRHLGGGLAVRAKGVGYGRSKPVLEA